LKDDAMNWNKLLSERRVRDLLAGKPSRGSTNDLRTQFERDYDRAVFSTPVRRLQDKAQVFPLEAIDGIRTRLTHSLEVSTVARDLAGQIFAGLAKKQIVEIEAAKHFTTIAATCALIHDVGNPPFGHAGEVAIQEWFKTDNGAKLLASIGKDADDFTRFDGNAQTIRLITKLQVLADQYGLNLTCGTLAAATKYLATSSTVCESPHQMSKLGIFASEAPSIAKVRDEVGLTGTARHPVTFIVEAADDIVYSAVDLEDGIKKGVLTWEDLIDGLKDELGENSDLLKSVVEGVGYQLGCDRPKDHIDQDAFGQAFRIQAIGNVVPHVRATFDKRLAEIEAGTYGKELVEDETCEAAAFVGACKAVGRKWVYASKDVLRLELMGRRIIHDLMDVFWEGAELGDQKLKPKTYPGKAYRLISANYRHVFENELTTETGAQNSQYHRAQLVVDYVAGMTDTFALALHKRLFNG
jgi:dGTPase